MFTDQVTTLSGWCFQLRTSNKFLQQYHSAADIQATWPTTASVSSSAKSKADLLSPDSPRYRYILNHQESTHAQKRPGSGRSRRWNRTTKPLLRVTHLPRRLNVDRHKARSRRNTSQTQSPASSWWWNMRS
jgi:hypothetical protein